MHLTFSEDSYRPVMLDLKHEIFVSNKVSLGSSYVQKQGLEVCAPERLSNKVLDAPKCRHVWFSMC